MQQCCKWIFTKFEEQLCKLWELWTLFLCVKLIYYCISLPRVKIRALSPSNSACSLSLSSSVDSHSLSRSAFNSCKTPASNMAQASTQRQRNKLSIAIFSAARRKWKFAVEFIICIIKMMTNGVERESSTKPRCELWMLWKNPYYNFSLLHDKDKTFSATFWVLFWLQF